MESSCMTREHWFVWVSGSTIYTLNEGLTGNENEEGPQFSTRIGSNLYRSWGGSVINMSALPGVKLAREVEIGYQMICMTTDYDCWCGGPDEDINVEMVMVYMKANSENARRFVGAVLD